ncbi:endolytic transglycosylase MltG [Myxococcus sp. K15C18031901]|uniref:endolytic transglycosylase MltG n=1 Tax=Myxococcus dinghuensis TaxID=2906761 RepID=UPI0020A7C055|nr:endolytic transglycosylase MltG [Myxococcus dinghuensis]MCP3101089.1 endolytic transglycosylase MltG [Myxococcus dinghuensis]
MLVTLLVAGVLAGAAVGGWFFQRDHHLRAFAATPVSLPAPVTVDVPPGIGPRTLARRLAERGVVTDAELLYLYLRREGLGPRLKAGEYEFSGALTPAQVVEHLVSGKVKLYRITVPEGLRAQEVFALLAASELRLDARKLEALSTDATFLRLTKVPAKSLEGFLFPDTYAFPRGESEEAVLDRMVMRAYAEYQRAAEATKPRVHLGMVEAITLASIVEKETGAPEERARIACVFHNRLARGMRLETDPTVLYALYLLRGAYPKNLTREDLRTAHPYNTYKVAGLPPGPIANPGAAALRAALAPDDCDDLFFVSRNDGTHVFCPTYACHEALVKQWQVDFFRAAPAKPPEAKP